MVHQQVIIFGEVLFDCFPDGNIVLGGAPFNVAWHLQVFGIAPLFISRIGNDNYGENIRQSMQDWGMDTQGLQIDRVYPTGLVKVEFIHQEPHYDIVANSAYDFISYPALPPLEKNSILYHGSLGVRNQTSAATLAQIKKTIYPPIFFDVNLRKPWGNIKTFEFLAQQTSWLKLNQQELNLIVPQKREINEQIEYLFSNFPLQQIIVTQGKAGATSFDSTGANHHIYPSKTTSVIDTVGAGDAFSSVLILGIVKGWEIQTTLTRAQEFASTIVGIQGATTNDKSFYTYFLKNWNLN